MPTQCTAGDRNASTTCNHAVIVPIIDTGACPGVSVEILEPPLRGNASLDGGSITYTPCANFVGADDFSYQLVGGTVIGPRTGVVTIQVGSLAGNCYCRASECCKDPDDPGTPKVWVRPEGVVSGKSVFEYDGTCYQVNWSCLECPDGTIVDLPDPEEQDDFWFDSCQSCLCRGTTVTELKVGGTPTYASPPCNYAYPCSGDVWLGKLVGADKDFSAGEDGYCFGGIAFGGAHLWLDSADPCGPGGPCYWHLEIYYIDSCGQKQDGWIGQMEATPAGPTGTYTKTGGCSSTNSLQITLS